MSLLKNKIWRLLKIRTFSQYIVIYSGAKRWVSNLYDQVLRIMFALQANLYKPLILYNIVYHIQFSKYNIYMMWWC